MCSGPGNGTGAPPRKRPAVPAPVLPTTPQGATAVAGERITQGPNNGLHTLLSAYLNNLKLSGQPVKAGQAGIAFGATDLRIPRGD